jgi:hypothetical protein
MVGIVGIHVCQIARAFRHALLGKIVAMGLAPYEPALTRKTEAVVAALDRTVHGLVVIAAKRGGSRRQKESQQS